MLPFYKKYWKTAFDIGLIILTVYLTMSLFSYLYKIATPIFLSFIIYLIIEPLAKFLHRRGIKKAIASAISVLVFILLLLSVFFGLSVILIAQISSLIDKLPDYSDAFKGTLNTIIIDFQHKANLLPPDVLANINKYLGSMAGKASTIGISVLNTMLSYLQSFSSFLVNFGIGIILAYFLSTEIKSWQILANEKTPRTFKNAFIFLRENVFRGLGIYIKAQFKLISITFVGIFVGLIALNVSNAFTLALISALLDLLPLVGVPVLFIPWVIYLFIVGNTSLAIWLLVVLGIVMLVRQIMEPKITGNTLGVSAFTMLSCMMISLSLFGVAGLVLSPILLILIKALMDQGYIKRWIRMPKEEFDGSEAVISQDIHDTTK
ncbi:sporulation integral membrane protein YtvI [Paenibacillus selenitireducens]|uniref:Sporulation integral membrane protein YtvI n=1 Tax=Paenibacillus selenitireducens TaxID=1324314 RepID=A0A1T2XKM6_9BACL|nr:sporulation integral membrane protein YtvI [Paenibacillus selenitireducens]OPA80427.1 sporulation integral membrane protein YtvI [Paenibacillus selenitireducens]